MKIYLFGFEFHFLFPLDDDFFGSFPNYFILAIIPINENRNLEMNKEHSSSLWKTPHPALSPPEAEEGKSEGA
ncbi:MAG: hypothetical protein A2Z51_05985 [Deltaproteobacteria bacterium RBG_19FT_COMBO_52_11]|nr:MAG: hypothetical protein A2Z51_05985 [Deltaproteobacteria bacterium RBG_19FT_COMBO_52_11]